MSNDVKILFNNHSLVGEGALWDEEQGVLYWIDILSNMLYIYDPASGEIHAYDVGQHVGTVVLRKSGGVMLAVYDGFASYDLASKSLTILADPEADLPNNRFNDGKCDPAGRFWAGTMAYTDQTTQGSLYRMDADLSVHKMLGNIAISNGIVWSSDKKTMYYIDSLAFNVRAFAYDNATGAISNERVVIEIAKELGLPDGMAIDAEDKLWVAHFGGSAVRRWDPTTGQILATIELPAKQITSCAFGDANLDTLYITSAANGMDAAALAKEPAAGALFAVKPGVRGVTSYRFAG